MSIQNKLIMGATILVIATGIVVSGCLSWLSIGSAERILKEQAVSKLKTVSELNQARIERYFQQIDKQLLTLANDRMTIDAMHRFKQQSTMLADGYDEEQIRLMRRKLMEYYDRDFANEYAKKTGNRPLDAQALGAQLDEIGVIMQYFYIYANKHPLGQKDHLVEAKDGSQYSQVHGLYHPSIRDFQSSFGYYDIFLVAPDTGRVVYTVFKELDFATSLKNGAYANSGLGRVFQRANQLNRPGTVLEDFSPYIPSYDAPAAFAATPIFDQGKKIGILIFQMPIDEINAIMTNNQRWEDGGLGHSGESYLIGADGKMRSLSRFLIDDKKNYLKALKDHGTGDEILKDIELQNTNIGLQRVATQGAEAAINGESGIGFFDDYRGVSVISAYAPLNVKGLNWAILTEIDQEEAFQPVVSLKSEVLHISLLVLVFLAGLAWVIGRFFASIIIGTIKTFSDSINNIVKDDRINLTYRLDESGKDEFSDLAKLLNSLLRSNQDAVMQIIAAGDQLESAAGRLTQVTSHTRQQISLQNQQTELVATAMNEMSATVHEVARNTLQTADKANEGDQQADEGGRVIANTIENINSLSHDIENAEQTVKKLQQESEAIGSVLDVIRGIAEQTNLLALNAAIEAARAGEQGRGFAVVADEVRTLASRTQDSTQQIQDMIERLQTGAHNSVQVMEQSNKRAKETVDKAELGHAALAQITAVIAEINDMTSQIATAAEEQSAVTEEINANVVKISNASTETLYASGEVEQNSDEMSTLANHLQAVVRVFIV